VHWGPLMSLRYFGTDGVRGPALAPPLRLSDLTRWGAAWAEVAASRGVRSLVLGWDPRHSSAPMAEAFSHGVGGALPLRALGMVPTPAVAAAASRLERAWGVVISASHNPPEDNGVKGFDERGEKLGDAEEEAIEEAFDRAEPRAGEPRPLSPDPRAGDVYLDALGDLGLPDDFRMVVDCAHGATAPFAPAIFRGGQISWIGVPADGARINVGVGATSLARLQAAVRERGADVGVAFDGDGDRCLMVDPRGDVVDGDQLLWLLVQSRIAAGDRPAGVVGTVMSNEGLAQALASVGVPFVRAPVGDRYLIKELRERGWELAAEASGHLIQRRLGPTGDGLLTALSALRALLQRAPLARWAFRFTPWPLRMMNVRASEHVPLERCRSLSEAKASVEQQWGADMRVVVRWSGTEPKLRLMVEGKSEPCVDEALRRLEAAAHKDLMVSP
jgi:phosphoglucosamine mutase